MMQINRLAGEVPGTMRAAEGLKNDAAKAAQNTAAAAESSQLSLKVQVPEAEHFSASRSEKVEQLKAAIAAGTYNPDPELVARKILGVE